LGRRVILWVVVSVLLALPLGNAFAEPPKPGQRDRCPVCGMFVSPYDAWIAAATLSDGSIRYFDGPKDLFAFVLEPSRYLPRKSSTKIVDLWVTDYYTLQQIDARDGTFVVGSAVTGPMGHEFVPVGSKTDAAAFIRDHGGRALSFEELTPEEVLKIR
jgi:copper chaperone NosL